MGMCAYSICRKMLYSSSANIQKDYRGICRPIMTMSSVVIPFAVESNGRPKGQEWTGHLQLTHVNRLQAAWGW